MAKIDMRGIRPRGSGYAIEIMVSGSRRYGAADSLDAALAVRERLRKGLPAHSAADPSTLTEEDAQSWTLGQAYAYALEHVWSSSRSQETVEKNYRVVKAFFGEDTRLSRITTERVDEFISECRRKGNGGSTINRKLSCLSKIMKTARVRRGCRELPHFQRQREGVNRVRFLSADEEALLLQHLTKWGKLDHLDACKVLIDTGARPKEIWTLRAKDVDFEQGLVYLTDAKSDAKPPRPIPMTARVRSVLSTRATVAGKDGLLFAGANNDWMNHVWTRVRTLMDLDDDPQFIPYIMRHTCASRLVQRGVSIVVVKEWMGHTNIQTTMRYAHLCPKNLMDVVGVLEQ